MSRICGIWRRASISDIIFACFQATGAELYCRFCRPPPSAPATMRLAVWIVLSKRVVFRHQPLLTCTKRVKTTTTKTKKTLKLKWNFAGVSWDFVSVLQCWSTCSLLFLLLFIITGEKRVDGRWRLMIPRTDSYLFFFKVPFVHCYLFILLIVYLFS